MEGIDGREECDGREKRDRKMGWMGVKRRMEEMMDVSDENASMYIHYIHN